MDVQAIEQVVTNSTPITIGLFVTASLFLVATTAAFTTIKIKTGSNCKRIGNIENAIKKMPTDIALIKQSLKNIEKQLEGE